MSQDAKLPSTPLTAEEIDLLQKVLPMVLKNRRANVSFIQRQLRIGYSAGLNVMTTLVELRVVGKRIGKVGYRKVLWDKVRIAKYLSEHSAKK